MEPSGNAGVLQRLNLGAIVAGAAVSLLASVVLDLLLGLATRGSAPYPGNAAFFAGLSSKLVAFLLGGYAAGRIASRWGGLNGVIAALANVLLTYVFSAVAFAVVLLSVASGSGSVGVAPGFSGEPGPSLHSLLTMLLILAYLATPFLSGYLGGMLGERHASRSGSRA
jgi:hypothetical protein